MKEPLILDIKGNSLDDGPGIRSVVFFQGVSPILACGAIIRKAKGGRWKSPTIPKTACIAMHAWKSARKRPFRRTIRFI